MSTPLQLLLLGTVIGSNNLAAALALGALGQKDRRRRIVAVFGVTEFVVPLVGIWLGRGASALVRDHVGWLAPALLAALGLWAMGMAWLRWDASDSLARRVTTWRALVVLALALSVDNLLVGFSLGLGGTDPWLVAATIALFSMVFAWIGLGAGRAARRHWERYAEFGAGFLLLLLAAAMAAGWI